MATDFLLLPKPRIQVDIEVNPAASSPVAVSAAVLHSNIHPGFSWNEHNADDISAVVLASSRTVIEIRTTLVCHIRSDVHCLQLSDLVLAVEGHTVFKH